ncbi:Putative ribonuclease H protein At1g65750 [Linum perenne]
MERRLDTWKANFLSFGGRVTLIKSVHSSLPVYYLSLFKAPAAVISSLERIQNHFLWSGVSDQNKIHWVSWNLVKAPRDVGGLGIQDLRSLNVALLCKWHWRYAVERTAWWRILINLKCGSGFSDWQPVWHFSTAGSSVWKWVVSLSPIFWSYGVIDPGGGMCVFWSDYWVRNVRLDILFPRIAAAVRSLESLICDVFPILDRQRWHIPLRYQLRGGALEEWDSLIQYLDSIRMELFTEGPAYIRWPINPDGYFTVSSLRRSLIAEKFKGCATFPAKVVWQSAVPTKVSCFCWKVFFSKIATVDNLQRKGFAFVTTFHFRPLPLLDRFFHYGMERIELCSELLLGYESASPRGALAYLERTKLPNLQGHLGIPCICF